MADDLSITPGTGKTIATDEDAGARHYQLIKLADGTANATAVIAADVGVKANALRVAPASDITDATYIGDIKFGEALPAGAAAIGKLAANTGVDIGDVDVTSVIPGTGATALGKAEDAAHTTGDTGVLALGVRQAANAPLSGLDGDYEPIQTDANGHVKVNVIDALPTGANAIGKLAANSGVDIGDVDVTSIAAGDNNIGNVDIVTLPAGNLGAQLSAASLSVVPASNVADATYLGDIKFGENLPGGAVADDAASTANALLVGGVAVETDGTDPTSVSAEGDLAQLRADRNRRLLVNTGHPNAQKGWDEGAAAEANQQLIAAPAAGLSIYVTDVIFSNGAQAGTFFLVEDTAVAATQLTGAIYLGVNAHAIIQFKTPIRLTAAKNLGYTCAGNTTHGVTVSGYVAP